MLDLEGRGIPPAQVLKALVSILLGDAADPNPAQSPIGLQGMQGAMMSGACP